MEDIFESRNTLINIAEEIELAKLQSNNEKQQEQPSGGIEPVSIGSDSEVEEED